MALPSGLVKQRRGLAKAWFRLRVPIIVVGVLVVVAGAAWFAYDRFAAESDAERDAALRASLTAQAGKVAAPVRAALAEVRDAVDPAGLVAVLAGGDRAAAARAAAGIAARHESLRRAWLLPRGHDETDYSSVPPLTFASLDLLRRAERSGKAPPPEVHLLGEEGQSIAAVIPLPGDDGEVAGHLLLAFDVGLLERAAKPLAITEGYLELQQPVSGAKPLVIARRGDAASRRGPPGMTVNVPGTGWRLAYWRPVARPAEAEGGPGLVPLAAVAALVVLAGAGLVWLRRRRGAAGPAAAEEAPVPALDPLAAKLAALKAGTAPPAAAGGAPPPAEGTETASEGTEMKVDDSQAEPAGAGEGAAPAAADRAGGAPGAVELPESIFRSYDVRGVVGKTLTPEIVHTIGRALGSEARDRGQQTLAVACDGRDSGPDLLGALSDGLRSTGRDVIDVGRVPTPVLYFATHYLETGSGVMVTGSHNPPEYNGLKIMLGGETLFGDDIKALRTRALAGDLAVGEGAFQSMEIVDEYVRRISEEIPVALGNSFKLVVDCGNGIAGAVAPKLFRALGHDVIDLYCEVDGSFPNHHPDPSQPENLADLIAAVRERGADLGFAFDGDGDRLGVVDGDGNVIWPDRQMMLFALDVLSRNPGAEIVFDVKCSSRLARLIKAKGGKPVMWKTGHSFIKNKLKESGAPLAGEMSGHIFFQERWYGFDDAMYAAARMLEILMGLKRKPAEVFAKLPAGVATPELRLDMAEGEHYAFMERLMAEASFDGGEVTTIDGLRVDYPDAWGLVRASNTTPCLVLRFEGDDQEALERVQERFRQVLLCLEPGLELPF